MKDWEAITAAVVLQQSTKKAYNANVEAKISVSLCGFETAAMPVSVSLFRNRLMKRFNNCHR
jgi:hypothetical protein